MHKGCLVAAIAVLAVVAIAIGCGVYLVRLYDARRDADAAVLRKANLDAGILSREGYVYHVILHPPLKKEFRDTDLRHLAEIKHLEILWVYDVAFTDRSLEELAKLRGLQRILLSNTKVTDQGVDRLQKALPQAEIIVTH